MGFLTCKGAQLQCSMGTAPSSLTVIRPNIKAGGADAGNVSDFAPNVNVMPFGMCNSTTNPQVISATAAAQGVHTPMPCVPVTTAPWSPGATKVKIVGQAALDDGSTAMCTWNGSISIKSAGQTKVKVT